MTRDAGMTTSIKSRTEFSRDSPASAEASPLLVQSLISTVRCVLRSLA
jgi:hypothetical protein